MGGAIYCENCKYFENEGKYLNNSASLGGSVYISGGSISTTSLTNFIGSSASFEVQFMVYILLMLLFLGILFKIMPPNMVVLFI